MKHSFRSLLLITSALFSLSTFAQDDFVSDWMIGGQTTPLSGNEITPNGKYVVPWEMHPVEADQAVVKPGPADVAPSTTNDYVGDGQILPPLPAKEESVDNDTYIADWAPLGMDLTPTPQGLYEAEKLHFKEFPQQTRDYSIEHDFIPQIKALYGYKAPNSTYSVSTKDNKGLLRKIEVFDSATNSLLTLAIYLHEPDGSLISNITEYYPDGSIDKQYQLKNGKLEGNYQKYSSKTASTEYGTDGISVIANNKYDVNGKILKTLAYDGSNIVVETSYGWRPHTRRVESDILNNVPGSASLEKQANFITQVKKLTGAQISIEQAQDEDLLLWHVDEALKHIVKKIGNNMVLDQKEIDLIFNYEMFNMLITLADKYEYYGDREGAPTQIRYRALLLGAIAGYNAANYNNVTVDQYGVIINTYERLNLINTAYSSEKMMKYLEDQSIVPTNNELLNTTITISNNIIRTSPTLIKSSRAIAR